MEIPLRAGAQLHPKDWESVRLRLMFDCCKWDIQSEDHSVVADFPLFLEEEEWNRLASLAEKMTAELLAAERELLSRPDLHGRLGLPRAIESVLKKCSPEKSPAGAARVMRFDFHMTPEGWRISEVNSDVPGGFIEAAGFTELMAGYYPGYSRLPNPATLYLDAIASGIGEASTVALVHATAHCDDRQVMEYLGRGLRQRGMEVVPVAPNHLQWESGFARIETIFAAARPKLLVRFFPAEWLPNLRPPSIWEPWFSCGKTPMSNPGPAILIQTKRFPLVCREFKIALPIWQSLLPETRCPSEIAPESPDWVFKPVFGRVGEDIAIADVTEPQTYKQILKNVKRHPRNWVAQKRFASLPLETPCGVRYACLGVFTVDGHAAGIYGRIAAKPLIDQEAQDVAVFIQGRD